MRYADANMANVPSEIKEALATIKGTSSGLLMYGKTGSGKTYCLHAIKNSTQKAVHMENWVELMLEIRDRVSQGKEIRSAVNDICQAEILFIDDLGAENQTPFSQEVLYILVNRFYIAEKRIVIATNLTLAELAEKYGDRIFSRIAEMCALVEVKSEDRRLA